MRVLVLANDFGPPWDEAGKNNARAVALRLSRTHEVAFAGLGPESGKETIEGLPGERVGSPGYRTSWKRLLYPFGYLKLMARAAAIAREFRPDAMVCFWETASTGIGAALFRWLGAPEAGLIQVVWTDCYTMQAATPGVWLREHLPNLLFNGEWLAGLAMRLVDSPVATSGYLARRLSAVSGREVLAGGHGVDTDVFRPEPFPEAGRPREWVAGYLGHATHAKGIDVLLDAMRPELASGERELWLALSESAEAAELAARPMAGVRCRGFTSPAEFYAACDLVILPRVSSYGTASYPNVALEAMACGRPVLTTYQPGIEEIIRDGETGFLVAPGDPAALRRRALAVLGDGSLRERVGRQARRFVEERLSWDRAMEPLERALEKLGRAGAKRTAAKTGAGSSVHSTIAVPGRGPRVVVAREHESLLPLLREYGRRGLALYHADQHCDMRGLVVDRPGRRARWLYGADAPDSGNVLGHAAAEGWVERVVWLHGDDGGREHDLGTFLWESEAERWPWTWLGPPSSDSFPLSLEIQPQSRAAWPESLDVLGLDWDYFASFPCTEEYTQRRIEHFLGMLERAKATVPPLVFVCASPGYASAHRKLFDHFLETLAARQGGLIEERDEPWGGSFGDTASGRTLATARYLARETAVRLKRAGGFAAS